MSERFDPAVLRQTWPMPADPRPIVTFGAGSIVRDAHFPAYRKAGFAIAGLFDPDLEKARKLADEWGVKAFERIEDAAAVLGFATTFVMVAGAFQMVDGLQAIGAGLLRGIKDTRIPMILALISYWAVGFVLAYMLAFPLGFGGIGIWLGFVFGLLAASILLLGRFAILVRRMPANP